MSSENKWVFLLIGLVIGSALGIGSYVVLNGSQAIGNDNEIQALYWVAPMDPNYRRDEPGTSPMGMDLIPVYEDGGSESGDGTVYISPRVANNLGLRTQIATIGSLHNEIKAVGYVQYNEDKLVHIHPRISGWLEKLYVKAEGDPVTKNQPLYEIYSPELVNAQEELLLALERNNSRLVRAAKDRLLALQVDQTIIDALEKSRAVKQTITIYSPQDGIVDNLNVREGFYVKPDTTMMQIGALDEVWVQGEVFERQADLVQTGVPVTMRLDYLPGRNWQGQVDYVYPTLDAKTRTVKVRMRFKNPQRTLKPNMFAQLIIHVGSGEPTLLIPKQALIRTANLDRVVVAQGDGHFKSVPVSVGRMDTNNAEIIEGIKDGDVVVTSAQFLLDSESNITAELTRMSGDDVSKPSATPTAAPIVGRKQSEAVWVEANINNVILDRRILNITHQPIRAWNWPVMTMSFDVSDNVDLKGIKTGTTVRLEMTKLPDDSRVISNIHFPDAPGDSMNESSVQPDAQ